MDCNAHFWRCHKMENLQFVAKTLDTRKIDDIKFASRIYTLLRRQQPEKKCEQEKCFFLSRREFCNRSVLTGWISQCAQRPEELKKTNVTGNDETKHLYGRRKSSSINNCLFVCYFLYVCFFLSLSASIAVLVWLVITFRGAAGRHKIFIDTSKRERTSKQIINF